MHAIEPYFNWRHIYTSDEDELSPFYEKVYNEFQYHETIYNYYIHPQWDGIGSPTLYIKIIYCDYVHGYAVIELLGEWNDCHENDIMQLKREIIDSLMKNSINKFLLIGENVLNFHFDDDDYYQEWREDVDEQDGWITFMNFREHIIEEFDANNLRNYINYGNIFNHVDWRTLKPNELCDAVDEQLMMRID